LPEFHLDERLGESRAAVVAGEKLLEMHIRRDGDGPPAGSQIQARLVKKLGKRGIARLGDLELLVEPWPAQATEGALQDLEITRAAWLERGRPRLAKARPLARTPTETPSLVSWLRGRGLQHNPGWPDWLAEQWDDALQQARSGHVLFAGGSLQLTPTPALVAVDVDSHGGGANLAADSLRQLARLIPLWRLGGNIVIDLPNADKPARSAAVAAFDAAMAEIAAPRFERTAINGFGLMQIVCERRGPSILERAWFDRAGSDAIDWLQTVAHSPDTGPIRLPDNAAVRQWLQARPHLLQGLAAQTHRPLGRSPA